MHILLRIVDAFAHLWASQSAHSEYYLLSNSVANNTRLSTMQSIFMVLNFQEKNLTENLVNITDFLSTFWPRPGNFPQCSNHFLCYEMAKMAKCDKIQVQISG